jgi:hypothetical protein
MTQQQKENMVPYGIQTNIGRSPKLPREKRQQMSSKQYENFMNILRKANKTGWNLIRLGSLTCQMSARAASASDG